METDPPQENRPGKFSCPRDELLYNMSLNGWSNDSSGDVQAPTGFFARISNSTDEISEVIEAFDDDLSELARRHAKELVGHFMLYEDNQGAVGVDVYADHASLLADYEELERTYSAWLMEEGGL